MKGTRRSKVWLALGLVAMACLVLAGCPHNNLLDSSGGGGAGNGGGGRGGSDGVRLVVTNFVDGGPVASRSIGWLGGPQRTIAPEHVDLKVTERIEEYIFVVSGNGDAGSYGPKIVDISAGTGIAQLPDMNDGYWDITIDAYNVDKLKAAEITMIAMDRNTIMQTPEGEIETKIVAHKEDAVVLSGQASLHLGGNTNQVTLTLTSSSEAKFGDVNVAVYFPDVADRTTIFADGTSKYVVKARLVDPASYQTIMGGVGKNETSEVTLFDLQNGGGPVDTAFVGGSYKYKVYDEAAGSYNDETVDENGGKLLQYRPSADPTDPTGAGLTPYKIPVGKYVLLVEVTDPAGGTYYAMDREFYVEGNRTTMGVLEIRNLLGADPKKPTGFEVYYSTPTTTDSLVGYDATFRWAPDPADMATVSYEIEIANITALYKNGGNSQVDVDGTVDNNGHTQFTGGEQLWSDTGLYKTDMDTIRQNYVTSITWSTQTHTDGYPFVRGSLLAGGGNSITLRLDSGNVYSARIRATNGTSKNSDWVYFTDIAGGAGVVPPTKFAKATATGIFDLVAITYRLQEMDMYTLTADRHNDMKVVNDTLVTDLLQVYEYDPTATEKPLSYGFTKDRLAQTVDEQVLVAKGDIDKKIIPSWQGWQDEKDGAKMFGPVAGQNTKADMKYDGFTSLTLVPVGAGGSSLKVQVETADTTNVLSLATVGFDTDPIAAATLASSTVTTAGLPAYKTSDPAGVYRNTAGNELVVVLNADSTNRNAATTDLYVAIGNSDAAGGVEDTLSDKNGNPITVKNLVVELKQGTSTYKTTAAFTPARPSGNPAYAKFDNGQTMSKLGGVAPRKYKLYITMTTAGGYTQSVEIPVTILYQDQTASIPNIP
ncbi:MAG: hypothetical protein IJW57_04825 [Spirochaetaceae bacterium]|nr:hypothetical protein [Spirochaetaceae bacterium]MBQ8561624.1 hypothetical protein [Spirochaetaceae bacterium]